jgi:hypothetical protein
MRASIEALVGLLDMLRALNILGGYAEAVAGILRSGNH